MTHPTYADTGEPVLIGEAAYATSDLGYFSLDFFPAVEHHVFESAEIMQMAFYRHRHNAIAAWEKLLEPPNGN